MKPVIFRLTKLGLSENEAKAYVALLEESPASAYEIAKKSRIPTSKVYEVLNRLLSKEIIQTIHGERSMLYIPLSPAEFVQDFRASMEGNLQELQTDLLGVETGIDTGYTWHIKEYNNFIRRGQRMIDTARETIIMLVWPEEMTAFSGALLKAEARGVKVAVVHYGATGLKIARLYRHPVDDTIYTERDTRGFALVADSKEALSGKIDQPNRAEFIWSMNEGFVMMAEDYIRHDIYFMKLASRFNPLLQEKFGERYQRLRDIFTDDTVPG